MPYATPADMIARFGEPEMTALSDAVGAGVPDNAALSRALALAEDEIDGYLRGRYALPVSSVPAVLARIACDIARFELAVERATDEMRARHDDARRLLEAIAAGRVKLGMEPAGVAAPGAGGSLEVARGTRARDWGMLA